MAFVRTKKVAGQIYYYLVESYLQEGRVKQRVLRYLGKEIPKKYMKDYRKRESRVATRKPGNSRPADSL